MLSSRDKVAEDNTHGTILARVCVCGARRQRYHKLFDVVWVANLHVHRIAATPESVGIQVRVRAHCARAREYRAHVRALLCW